MMSTVITSSNVIPQNYTFVGKYFSTKSPLEPPLILTLSCALDLSIPKSLAHMRNKIPAKM